MASYENRISHGEKVVRVKVRVRGTPTQTATFKSMSLAKKWAAKTETEINEGHYMPTMKARRHTLSELIDTYLEKKKVDGAKGQETSSAQLEVWRNKLGEFSLLNITPGLITKTINEIAGIDTPRGTPKTPATLNRYLAVLSSALTYGVKSLGWLDNNPVFKVERRQEPKGRVRFLSDDERARLLVEIQKAANPFLFPAVILAISTGARRMEILSLKWADVDLGNGWAVLQDTKNGERRGIPVKVEALKVLRELHEKHLSDIWVFPNEEHTAPFDIRRSWEKAVKDAGIENFRFHDLRHTFASYMIMNKASLGEIADALGHKTLQMTKRYSHISDDHKGSIVEKMNNKIFGGTNE